MAELTEAVYAVVSAHARRAPSTKRQFFHRCIGHHIVDDQRAGGGLLGKCRLPFRGVAEVISCQRARVRCDTVRQEPLLAVAAPEVAQRIDARADFGAALCEEPLLAYSLNRPLMDAWLQFNQLDVRPPLPALLGQDLRGLQRPLQLGVGWTVLPHYLCADALKRGTLVEIEGPVGRARLDYYLMWTAAGLRQPRVPHARQALLWRLESKKGVS